MYWHKKIIKGFLLGVFFLAVVVEMTQAQSKNDLESERKDIINRIYQANQVLDRTRQKKTRLLKDVSTTTLQIRQRERLLTVIDAEMKYLNQSISETESVIESLEKDLLSLKKEYAEMITLAFKANNRYSKLALLFASKNVNQLLSRIRYFDKYNDIRKEQIKQIEFVQVGLLQRKKDLETKKLEKMGLIQTHHKEKSELQNLKEEQNSLISEVKQREDELRKELKKEQKVLDELEKLISNQIRSVAFAESLSPEDKNLSKTFMKAKGRLPWPVDRGFIAGKFGLQKYVSDEGATHKDIQIMRLGIDIRTRPSEKVKAIFSGSVVDVTQIAGRGYLVIIQHGDYFSVYSKLGEVMVSIGDKVRLNQRIGTVGNFEDTHEIELQIWRHQDKLNPEDWLVR